ncbi:MAG TPA: M28 family peptidase [bacterium]|nr:M28 family peptidase [bacterium]
MTADLTANAARYLRQLCTSHPHRCVGSIGNRAASRLVADHFAACGLALDTLAFDCFDWHNDGATLRCGSDQFQVQSGPYSLPAQLTAPCAAFATIDALEQADITGTIVLLHGELAGEQLMPKNFPFYNPEEHQRVYRALEGRGALAVLAATARIAATAGAVYPFPLIEDGDFSLPTAYMTDREGARLLACAGRELALTIATARQPARGYNVIGRCRPGTSEPRIVVCAHLDTKQNTPGALDNAAGVTVLMLLAELLRDYRGPHAIELNAFNGEDYYAAPGQLAYLEACGDFSSVALCVNIDAAGYHGGGTAYSLYNCPPDISAAVQAACTAPEFAAGELWYQGDHSMFIQQGRPAMAITTAELLPVMTRYTHTPADTIDLIDPAKLAAIATAIRALLPALA